MTKFPQQLIERIQKHFANKFHCQISSEQAVMYLEAWGELYLIMARGRADPGLPGAGKPDEAVAALT